MGGIIIFIAISRAVPDPVGLRLARGRASTAPRWPARCSGFADDYTKIVQRRSLGLRGADEARSSRSPSRWGCGGSPRRRPGLPDTLRLRIDRRAVDLGLFYPVFIYLVVAGTTNAVNLTDGLDGLAAGCAAIVLLAYIGITFITPRPARPGAARRLPGRRLRRLPVVQRVPGDDLHGRHRLARARRRDRRPGGDDQDRGAADPARRHLRGRGAQRAHPGLLVPDLPQAGVPDGARSTTTSR